MQIRLIIGGHKTWSSNFRWRTFPGSSPSSHLASFRHEKNRGLMIFFSFFPRFYLNALSVPLSSPARVSATIATLLVPSGFSLSPRSPCLCLRPVRPFCPSVHVSPPLSSLSLSTSTRNSVGFGLSDRRMDWIENETRSGQVCYRGNAIQKLNSVCTVD